MVGVIFSDYFCAYKGSFFRILFAARGSFSVSGRSLKRIRIRIRVRTETDTEIHCGARLGTSRPQTKTQRTNLSVNSLCVVFLCTWSADLAIARLVAFLIISGSGNPGSTKRL